MGRLGVSFLLTTVAAADLCGQEIPRLMDARLELKLFAETPDIVTPIGMVIDAKNRIFVIESHTHHPPAIAGTGEAPSGLVEPSGRHRMATTPNSSPDESRLQISTCYPASGAPRLLCAL